MTNSKTSTTGGQYAMRTSVSEEKSRAEIERILKRYGASAFAYMTQGSVAAILFELRGRRIRFLLPLPDESAFRLTSTRQVRTRASQHTAWEQATRARWRALALIIKAKLEAIEAGVTTLEDEFLAHTMLPDGGTVGEWMKPQLDGIYASGQMPLLLLDAPSQRKDAAHDD